MAKSFFVNLRKCTKWIEEVRQWWIIAHAPTKSGGRGKLYIYIRGGIWWIIDTYISPEPEIIVYSSQTLLATWNFGVNRRINYLDNWVLKAESTYLLFTEWNSSLQIEWSAMLCWQKCNDAFLALSYCNRKWRWVMPCSTREIDKWMGHCRWRSVCRR